MHFKIASKNKAHDAIKKYGATHLVSINDVNSRTFQNRLPRAQHLTVLFEDTENYADPHAPILADIRRILEFASRIPKEDTVIVNCHAGMCRSTAVALGLAVQRYGVEHLDEMTAAMLEQRPQSCPNRLVAHLFDVALGTNGEILAAARKVSDRYMLDAFRDRYNKGCVLPPEE